MGVNYYACASILININLGLHTKFEMPSFTRSKDVMGPKNFKMDHVALTMTV